MEIQTKKKRYKGEKVLNIAIPADPKTLDPHFAGALSQIAIAENSFNGDCSISTWNSRC